MAAPIALIEKRSGPFAGESALLTAELSGYAPLSNLLYEAYLQRRLHPQAFTSLKRRVIDVLARLLGQLIEAQVVNPTLSSKHIFLTRDDNSFDFALIDVGRARLVSGLRTGHLVKPLSVLHRSLSLEIFSSTDRLRLFKRVFPSQSLYHDQKAFIKRIVRKAGQRGFKDINTEDY